MKKTICLFLFVLSSFILSAQTNVDSLVNVLETQKLSAEQQLDLYDKIAEYYSQNNAKKSLLYGKEGLRIAEKEKDKRMIARNCVNIGAAFLMTQSLDSSLMFLNQAAKLSNEVKDKETEARAFSVFGICYSLLGKNEEALEYYLKSLALYENTGNKANIARLMINISSFYGQMNQNERSLHYLEMAQVTVEKMDIENPKLKAAIYELFGGYYVRTGNYEKALEKSLIALDLSRKSNLIRYELATTQYLATIYADGFQDYEKAEKYALECVKAAESTESKEYLGVAWNILTKVYIDAGKYEKGKALALKIWDTDSTTVFSAINTANSLAVCYMYSGDKEKALYYYGKHDSLRVKEAEKQLQNSMANMEVKYETEKKEMRISVLEEERKLYIGLGIAIIVALLLGLGFLFYYYHSRRRIAEQQIKQLKQEKELIATRSALKAEQTEREIIARDLHDGVGAMLSVVKNNMDITKSHSIIENAGAGYLDTAMDVLDKSITELRRVSHHIMPRILIEEGLVAALDDFCRSIPEAEFHCAEPDRRFDPEKELVIYRCAYELINNALRHANSSRIEVHLTMDEELVYLSVVDYGDGFDPQCSPMGMGISNMRTRLSIFGGRIDIHSELGKGTEVNIELGIKGDSLSILTS